MKKSSIFWSHVVGLALLAMGGTAAAQNAKVGFVDVGRLLEDSPQAVAARQKLQNEFAPRNDELEKLHKEVSDLAQKLANESDVMSEEQRLEQEREVQRRRRDFERKRDEVREDLAIRRNEELGKLAGRGQYGGRRDRERGRLRPDPHPSRGSVRQQAHRHHGAGAQEDEQSVTGCGITDPGSDRGNRGRPDFRSSAGSGSPYRSRFLPGHCRARFHFLLQSRPSPG